MMTLGTSRIGKGTTISSSFIVLLLPDCFSAWLSEMDTPLDKPAKVSLSRKKDIKSRVKADNAWCNRILNPLPADFRLPCYLN